MRGRRKKRTRGRKRNRRSGGGGRADVYLTVVNYKGRMDGQMDDIRVQDKEIRIQVYRLKETQTNR